MVYDRTQQRRIDQGLCKDCGEPRGADGTTIYCRKCTTKISKRSYERKKNIRMCRKEAGLCPSCGKKPEENDGVVCGPCKKKQRDYYHSNKKRWGKGKEERKECSCCRNARFYSSKMCETHWYRDIARKYGFRNRHEDLANLLEKQEFKCFYSGRPLVPGGNASIDHLHPRSKRPELESDLNNVAWVDRNVNRAKGNLSYEEFIRLCKEICSLH